MVCLQMIVNFVHSKTVELKATAHVKFYLIFPWYNFKTCWPEKRSKNIWNAYLYLNITLWTNTAWKSKKKKFIHSPVTPLLHYNVHYTEWIAKYAHHPLFFNDAAIQSLIFWIFKYFRVPEIFLYYLKSVHRTLKLLFFK